MKNIMQYEIINDLRLIIEYYNGEFHIDELIHFKEGVGEDSNYNPEYNIIHDFGESHFGVEFSDIKKYVDFLLRNSCHVGKRKVTMITSTPNQVVTAMGFEMQKQNLPVESKVTSTFDAAASFVELSEEAHREIEKRINKMKTARQYNL